MRVSKFVVTLLSLTALAFVVPRLEAQVHPMTKMFECWKCKEAGGGVIGLCERTGENQMGQESCVDDDWHCTLSGMSCAILPPIVLQIQHDEAAPAVSGLKGGELRLAQIEPYLWVGGNCENGLRHFVSASADQAIALVELSGKSMELALK